MLGSPDNFPNSNKFTNPNKAWHGLFELARFYQRTRNWKGVNFSVPRVQHCSASMFSSSDCTMVRHYRPFTAEKKFSHYAFSN